MNSRISYAEKEELLDFKVETSRGLSRFSLLLAFYIMFLMLSTLLPKIYLSNNIYYASRDISRLSAERELLNEERLRLEREIEIINNKHLMLNLKEKK